MLVLLGCCAAFAEGGFAPAASAQPASPAPAASAAAPSNPAYAKLVGSWVRPDGGYVIAIRGVDANGRVDAAYANPRPLPFSQATAVPDGTGFKLFFELRAAGYDGSTYTLTYDPARDTLKGVYYQAVAKQRFDVQFVRAK
jgi:hypothetical protein